jgi:excisionase family DNA binding protein
MSNASNKDWRTAQTISVEEAGRVLGIGRSSAYVCARSGELPTIRMGSKYLVPVMALRRMVDGDTATQGHGPADEPTDAEINAACRQRSRDRVDAGIEDPEDEWDEWPLEQRKEDREEMRRCLIAARYAC